MEWASHLAIHLRDAVEAFGRLSVEGERDPSGAGPFVGAGAQERARVVS